MGDNNLQSFLVSAVSRKLCTQIYCTTCGAMEFRQGVVLAVTGISTSSRRLSRETILEIARALAGVTPVAGISLDDAVRCILFDLWSGMPYLDQEIEEILQGSWAGGVLQRMKAHHAALQAARKAEAEYQSSDAVHMRREAKRLLKQEQHSRRLEIKRERDKLWHSSV